MIMRVVTARSVIVTMVIFGMELSVVSTVCFSFIHAELLSVTLTLNFGNIKR
jgi:hypothetical protein